nr:heparan-alpha-glucosaminide N-acetyltransferase [Microvirga terricola]
MPQAQAAASQRWDAIDIARGIAIGAMIVYHFSWDVSFLHLIETDIIQIPAWRWFARGIAGSFLFLAGVGLALAHAQGFRRQAFLRRLAKVSGAAILVTAVTYFAFPESYIFFGILHCIAVSSILALPFLRMPPALVAVAAVLCFAAPWFPTSPVLDQPWLDWLGLGASEPIANDYVPIFPWFGSVLMGIAVAKGVLPHKQTMALAQWRGTSPFWRLLIFAGRKSLPIYLLHQVVLLAALYGVLQLTGPNPMADARPFIEQCEASCAGQNGEPGQCRAVCACIVGGLRSNGLWQRVLANNLRPEDQAGMSGVVQQCARNPS